MIQYVKTQLLSPWGFSRIIRLVLGGVLIIQAYQAGEALFGLLGGVFAVQGLLNIGICGAGSCGVPVQSSKPTQDEKETVYEEIKKDV